jgi:ribosomal protein S18 acetylase RimI-like enzyme
VSAERTVQFGPAVAADARALSDLVRTAKAAWGYPADWMRAWAGQFEITPDELAQLWVRVARVDGRAIGFVALDVRGPAEITHLWVSPGCQRRGVGRRLLAAAIEEARRRRLPSLAIDSDPNAAAFYEACGARVIGSRPAPMPGAPERALPRLQIDLASGPSPQA